jgi:Leucine-rich repeat (LRR) protein
MVKGPSPRLDLSKRNLEILKEADIGSFLNEKEDGSKTNSLKTLQSLFLQNNRFETFPSIIVDKMALYSLKVLYLNNNSITCLPNEIGKLNQLVKLHLENNNIK